MNSADGAESLQGDLEALGFSSTPVWTTTTAHRLLRKALPPVVLLDDRLARMRPLEYLRELRSSAGHHVPVIVLSSIRYTKARLESMRVEIGLGDVICRPFSLIDLVRMVRRFCDPQRPTSTASITDYTNPTEVFFILLGQAIRSERPMALVRERGGDAVHMFVEGTRLVAVTSSDPGSRSLEEILASEGLARGKDLVQAKKQMEQATNDRKLGEILVARSLVSVKDLNRCLQIQASLRFVDLFGWRRGTIRLLPNESPPTWSARVNLDVQPLIMRALHQNGDQKVLRKLVENLLQKKLSLPRELPSGISAVAETSEEKSFLRYLNKGRTVSQAIRLSHLERSKATIWVACLVFVLGAKPREKPMSSTMATLHQLRLRKLGLDRRPSAAVQDKAEADQAFALGWKMMNNELFESAVPPLRRALELNPRQSKTRACLGWCEYQLEQDPRGVAADGAMEQIRRAIQEKPELGMAHVFLGRMHSDRGEIKQSSEAFMKALEVDPGNSEAMAELRQIHQKPWGKEKRPRPAKPQQPGAPPETVVTGEQPTVAAEPQATASAEPRRPPPARPLPGRPPSARPLPAARPLSEADVEELDLESSSVETVVPPLADAAGATPVAPPLRTPRETPDPALALPIPFSLITMEWDAREVSVGDSGSAVVLDSTTKADLVHEVRSFGASLEEFSLTRLCVVIGIPKPVDDHRIQAAELALELVGIMKRACESAGHIRQWVTRCAIVTGTATPTENGLSMGETVATGRRLMGLAGRWQIIAEKNLYEGFQNLVETRVLRRRPQYVEVCNCLVKSRVMAGMASQPLQRSLATPAATSISGKPSRAGFESLSSGGDGIIGPGSMVETFQIERLVGSGGMGEVYLAVDVSLGRQVALKMIRPELLTRPTALRRFKREAQALAKINSQHVTHIYALSLESNPPYLVMEYVDGNSIHAHLKEEGTFSSRETAQIALQVVKGLQSVYLEGLTHRDINPKNLLLDKIRTLKITDFGLVQMELTGSSMSMTHSIVGTPSYMSPEQARGETVDFRTDLYSLGMTLYHMMVGKPPFTGETIAEILSKHIMEPVPSIRSFRPDAAVLLDELVQWLTAKKIDDRPQSYDVVAIALQAILPD